MTTNRPNVLFLTVDALRADRCSLYGYDRPTTPNLERMAKRAAVCSNAYSLASFTQASFPTIMTSTPPLAFGGFDNGAIGRPPSVFKVFAKAGYDVKLLSTFKWVTRYFGFAEGAAHEEHLYSPKGLMGTAVNRTKSSILLERDGKLSKQQMLAHVSPIIVSMFDDIENFCQQRLKNDHLYEKTFKSTNVIQDGFDFTRVIQSVDRHRKEFLNDPAAYVDKHFKTIPQAHEWIAADWRYCRKPSRLLGEVVNRGLSAILGLTDEKAKILRQSKIKQFVDGKVLADHVINTFNNHKSGNPFFIWTHFIDTHVPYLPGTGPKWWKEAPKYLKATGHDPKLDVSIAPNKRPRKPEHAPGWSQLYDAALRYVDEQIGRILDALEQSGLADNTLVVFLSDHGEELGEHGNYSHYFTLYRHSTWVPMLFLPPGGAGRTISGMTSLSDTAPTIAGYCGVSPDPQWTGIDLSKIDTCPRSVLVQETFYGGNCLFDKRPLYMAARTLDHSLIWNEYVDPEDRLSPAGSQLFDLRDDPLELNNIYSPSHPAAEMLERAIMERMAAIPEIGPQRASQCFPHLAALLNP